MAFNSTFDSFIDHNILDLIKNGEVSELSELDISDEEELCYIPNRGELYDLLLEQVYCSKFEVKNNNIHTHNHILPSVTPKKQIKWIQQPFGDVDIVLDDLVATPIPVILRRPIDYFLQYFDDEFFETIVSNTNLYAEQKNLINFEPTDKQEIKTLIAIYLVIGCLKWSQVQMYWDEHFRLPMIANAMTLSRFFELRQCIHVINNLDIPNNNQDKFIKVRPLYNQIKKKCSKLPKLRNLSIGEHMIPFVGRLLAIQYKRGKPCPWGITIFVLASESGMIHDFILYQGNSTELDQNNLNVFGFGASVVLHLVQTVKQNSHFLYFDKFFSTYKLFEHLHSLGIYAAGTVKLNRFADPPFLSDEEMSKLGRGSAFEIKSNVKNACNIGLLKWYCNKSVILGSNFITSGTIDKVQVYYNRLNKYVTVERPEIAKLYNAGIGGVVRSGKLIHSCRTSIISRKWTLQLMTHAFDLAASNAWLQYKKEAGELLVPKRKILNLVQFRLEVAKQMLQNNVNVSDFDRLSIRSSSPESTTSSIFSMESGNNSSMCSSPEPTSSISSTSSLHCLQTIPLNPPDDPLPPDITRYDMKDHLPGFDKFKFSTKCKNPACNNKIKTHCFCTKCNVHLCLTKKRNCFYDFHHKV